VLQTPCRLPPPQALVLYLARRESGLDWAEQRCAFHQGGSETVVSLRRRVCGARGLRLARTLAANDGGGVDDSAGATCSSLTGPSVLIDRAPKREPVPSLVPRRTRQ